LASWPIVGRELVDRISSGKMPSGGKYHDGTNDHCGGRPNNGSIQSSAGRGIGHHLLLWRLSAAPHRHHAKQESYGECLQGHLPRPSTDFIQGHSHVPKIDTVGGVLYLNPGSAGRRRFKLPITLATLEVTPEGIRPEVHDLGGD